MFAHNITFSAQSKEKPFHSLSTIIMNMMDHCNAHTQIHGYKTCCHSFIHKAVVVNERLFSENLASIIWVLLELYDMTSSVMIKHVVCEDICTIVLMWKEFAKLIINLGNYCLTEAPMNQNWWHLCEVSLNIEKK